MFKRVLILIGLILILAGCGGGDSPAPTLESPNAGLVTWIRDPYHVVFRAETAGGGTAGGETSKALYLLNEVPACTVYGDGRVVWTEETQGGGVPKVLFDVLSDERLTSFLIYLTVDLRFLTYTEDFPKQIPSATIPVYEKMTVAVNDVVHVTDAFSNWPDQYYSIVLKTCQTLAFTPRKFEPEGAWLSAQMVTYNSNQAAVIWDATAAGFSFNEVSSTGENRWIEGNLVKILWQALYDNSFDLQFDENSAVYQIALQVPGVTKDAPPAPAQ